MGGKDDLADSLTTLVTLVARVPGLCSVKSY